MGQDARPLIGVDPAIVLRLRGESLLAALDVEIGMRLGPRMIERGVVGHEIEHEPQAARGEPGAERGQRRLAAQRLVDLVGADGEARSADIVLRQIRQRRPELGLPGRIAARYGPARRARPPHAQEPDPVEAATREIIQGGIIDSGEGDRLAGLL